MYRLRRILFPFSLLYHGVTALRNFLFAIGLLKSHTFSIPIIAVGNLSVGGTGKTPQIEFLIRLLSDKFKVATLSRGYKRQSEGFVLANSQTTMEMIGDEPFQFFTKFKNIQVAVDANRKNGIENLLSTPNPPDVILLDDAYQHRKVKANFYILLTTYADLFTDDYILPTGNLRESRAGAGRSSVVLVTKCSDLLSETEKEIIRSKIKKYTSKPVFFTSIVYDDFLYSENEKVAVSALANSSNVLIAGIANPDLFFDFFKKQENCLNQYISFPDHYNFTENDINQIKVKANGNRIITTEKDYMRLKGKLPPKQLFYLPITVRFLENETLFNDLILKAINLKFEK